MPFVWALFSFMRFVSLYSLCYNVRRLPVFGMWACSSAG
ncbi:hypothetical protein NRI_0214 [Neorickettsia risticii str. Illinois]|uniref:Uncharacterized protein n=1 Tax=Neorickettsia risticii (strain Illinois) TaxID=434131 RepID=C6V490_NEORI|nr:hypothetical protein NRI_0214 [Neorickettsia risticii str. Illinois]